MDHFCFPIKQMKFLAFLLSFFTQKLQDFKDVKISFQPQTETVSESVEAAFDEDKADDEDKAFDEDKAEDEDKADDEDKAEDEMTDVSKSASAAPAFLTPSCVGSKFADSGFSPIPIPSTPFHFPSLLSPLPPTPRRGGDSCRVPNFPTEPPRTPKYFRTPTYNSLGDDLRLTSDESDISDFEKTPRPSDADRFNYSLSPR